MNPDPVRVGARSTGFCTRFAAAAVAAGALLRVQQLLARRSLWLDEALLAINVVERGFGRLLDPLDFDQGAPPLFLWAQRSALLVGGDGNEHALRAVPLLAGLALLPLVWAIGRRAAPGTAAGPVAAVLAAFSPTLVRYSTEVKQYAVDAAAVAAVVLLALVALDRRDARSVAALAGAGVVGVWLSHPVALALVGVGAVLAVDALSRRDTRGFARLVAAGAVCAGSLGGAYVVALRDLRNNDALEDYWAAGYPSGSWPSWAWDALGAFVDEPARLGAAVVVAALAAVGATVVGATRAAVLLAPAVVAIIAASLRLYPFAGRLLLFLVPLLLVLLGAAVHRFPVLTVPALLLVTAGWWGDTHRTPDSRPVFEHVATRHRPGDLVVVHGPAIATYRYYGPIVGLDADLLSDWSPTACDPLPAEGRLWFVFAYTFSDRPDDEVDRARRQLDAAGERLDAYDRHDASATLYELDGDGPPAPDDELGCLVLTPIE